MTPPTVQFIPAPASSGTLLIENGVIRSWFGGAENVVQADASSIVYNGWTFGDMAFYDGIKNGFWQNAVGCFWYMINPATYANWTGLILGSSGSFVVNYAGTTNLIFRFDWDGQGVYTTNYHQYGTVSVTYTGIVAPGNTTRCDVFWI